MHEACPQTPGVTPVADPQVTAQQVEAGTASLMDFAREASGQFKLVSEQSVPQAYYFACLIRQDGGPGDPVRPTWYSSHSMVGYSYTPRT